MPKTCSDAYTLSAEQFESFVIVSIDHGVRFIFRIYLFVLDYRSNHLQTAATFHAGDHQGMVL